ncbi:hypothetical protein FQN53_000200, partial [Emmonsiellopsis sp. PD_33]
MRDGLPLVTSSRHLYPLYAADPLYRPASRVVSQGLTPMNIAAIRRARVRSREVSERKQVGDAESLVNAVGTGLEEGE